MGLDTMAKDRKKATDKQLADYYKFLNERGERPASLDNTVFVDGALYDASDEDIAVAEGKKLAEPTDAGNVVVPADTIKIPK